MRNRLRKLLGVVSLSVALTLGGIYLGGNLLLPKCVVVVHDFELEVEVMATADGSPVPAANVLWQWSNERTPESIGTSDAAGRMQWRRGIAAQPRWVWPMVGEFSFDGSTLHVEAAGFRPWRAELGQLLPDVPLGAPRARLRIELTRQ